MTDIGTGNVTDYGAYNIAVFLLPTASVLPRVHVSSCRAAMLAPGFVGVQGYRCGFPLVMVAKYGLLEITGYLHLQLNSTRAWGAAHSARKHTYCR